MIKLGSLILNGTPKIVVGFVDTTPTGQVEKLRKYGIEIVELRIDQYSSFDPAHVLQEIVKFKDFSTIATIRSKEDGGHWNLSEEKRFSLFESIINEVSAIDIEVSAKTIVSKVIQLTHDAKKVALLSYHNFDRTPSLSDLNDVFNEAKSLGADVVKIATLAVKPEDIRTLASLTLQKSAHGIVTIAMGAEGTLSRVFFPALGSLLTYAYWERQTAPGQLDYKEMFELLRKFYPRFNNPRSHRSGSP